MKYSKMTHENLIQENGLRQNIGIVGICLSAVLLPFSVTGPGVALGDIARDIGSGPLASQWIINIYNFCFAALMFIAGVLASRMGRRPSLVAGLILFAIGSLICVFAPGMVVVLIGRGIQGVAAALILTAAVQYIAITLAGDKQRFVFAMLGSSFGAGLAIGPVLSGGLVDLAGWRSVFVLCASLAFVAAVSVSFLPKEPASAASKGDLLGTIVFTAALASVCGYFMVAADQGFVSLIPMLLLLSFFAAVWAFVAVEARAPFPIVDLNLFRNETFLAVVLQPFTILTAFAAILVYMPTYFQSHFGLSVFDSGLALLPLTIPVFILPMLVNLISARLGRRWILSLSPFVMSIGLIGCAIAIYMGFVWLEVALLVTGIGIGMAFGVMDAAAATVVPVNKVEVATGMFNSARLVSETVGISVVGSVLLALLRVYYDPSTADDLAVGVVASSDISDGGLLLTWTWIFLGLAALGLLASFVLFRCIDDQVFEHE